MPVDEQTTVATLLSELETDARLRGVRSWAQTKYHLGPIKEAFGTWRVKDITAPAVDAYIERRLADKRAAATINRETQILGQALRLGLERGKLATLPQGSAPARA